MSTHDERNPATLSEVSSQLVDKYFEELPEDLQLQLWKTGDHTKGTQKYTNKSTNIHSDMWSWSYLGSAICQNIMDSPQT